MSNRIYYDVAMECFGRSFRPSRPSRLMKIVVLVRLLCGVYFAASWSLLHAAYGLSLSVEPYMGYGTFSTSSLSSSLAGTILGGKGGIGITKSLWTALDFQLGGPYYLAARKQEILNRLWGIGMGYQLAGGTRLWGGYYFSAELDDTAFGSVTTGQGFKASIGFEFQSKLSANLDYLLQSYKAYGGTENITVTFISVSAPLHILK